MADVRRLTLMPSFRYSISDLLAVAVAAALLVWSGTITNPEAVIRYAGAVAIVAGLAAIRFRDSRPCFCSVFAATLFFASSLVYWWAGIWIGYFIHRPRPNAQPYFEDGMIGEGIVYPLVYFVVYSPVVAAIALFVSAPIVVFVKFRGTSPAASRI